MDTKGEIDSNTVMLGDFNTPLISMDRSSSPDQLFLIDIFRPFNPKAAEYTFFQVHMEHFLG